MQQLHAIVRGRVQGVAFRMNTQREATRLGLNGWVRNLPNGRVEVEALGSPAKLQALASWLAEGPRWARVDHLELTWVEVDNPPETTGFTIR